MHIKIYGGTPTSHGAPLCHTCRHSRITRGRKIDEELIVCNESQMAPVMITFKVTACSAYVDDRIPTYLELIQKAWILKPRGRNGAAGFVRASDLQDGELADVMAGAIDHDD